MPTRMPESPHLWFMIIKFQYMLIQSSDMALSHFNVIYRNMELSKIENKCFFSGLIKLDYMLRVVWERIPCTLSRILFLDLTSYDFHLPWPLKLESSSNAILA